MNKRVMQGVMPWPLVSEAKSQDGQTGHSRGQYFMYQVKIYNDMTLDDYGKASKAGTLKQLDATTVLGRDGWNGAPASPSM